MSLHSTRVTIGLHTYGVEIARYQRARRYVLRLTSEDTLRLTVPTRASISAGLLFAQRQGAWIEREHARQVVRSAPWRHGTAIWFRGERVVLQVSGGRVMFADQCAPSDPASLDLREVVEDRIAELAARELPARLHVLASQDGLSVDKVTVRNQRSRWGACSPRSAITLNWRIVQMPPHVSDYVILHELMHLKQPNHSSRFWREVERVCPEWRLAERWLRKHGKEIL